MKVAFNVINELTIDISEVYKKGKQSQEKGLCFKGENSNVILTFIDSNNSWIDEGCIFFKTTIIS